MKLGKDVISISFDIFSKIDKLKEKLEDKDILTTQELYSTLDVSKDFIIYLLDEISSK